MRLACCSLVVMILTRLIGPYHFIKMNSYHYDWSNKNMEESPVGIIYKIPLLRTSIKIKNLIILSFKHITKIFEYRYQHHFLDRILPSLKQMYNLLFNINVRINT